nr:MAG TPA: hypothetical protein [Caudoviricetes sp.]
MALNEYKMCKELDKLSNMALHEKFRGFFYDVELNTKEHEKLIKECFQKKFDELIINDVSIVGEEGKTNHSLGVFFEVQYGNRHFIGAYTGGYDGYKMRMNEVIIQP